ncbi:MAG: hypothetical protein IOC90_05615 [Methylocystis sp.]|nr:hypothetical protein [Methylocystis sp.]MCA3584797.1 hypothetical protein [Methylocystis sp.]MCA3587496.1 hypothetical protein [Methylocystis sp.]MCA3592992.1 hypothetical protein [Methylocystis sp.]
MLRLVVRLLGYLALALGMAVGVHDGARSIADGGLPFTSLGTLLAAFFPRAFALIESAVGRYLHPLLWDSILMNLLLLPAIFVLFAAGTSLLLIGRTSEGPAKTRA